MEEQEHISLTGDQIRRLNELLGSGPFPSLDITKIGVGQYHSDAVLVRGWTSDGGGGSRLAEWLVQSDGTVLSSRGPGTGEERQAA